MSIEKNNPLIISEYNYQNLLSLIEKHNTSSSEKLDDELGRAEIVCNADFPDDVVTMDSTVTFIDLDTAEKSTISLVYPPEANIEKMKISILSPVGTALIGLRIGGMIDRPLPNGKIGHLQVVAVTQPEKMIKPN